MEIKINSIESLYDGILISLEGNADVSLLVDDTVVTTETIKDSGYIKAELPLGKHVIKLNIVDAAKNTFTILEQNISPIDPLYLYFGESGITLLQENGIDIEKLRTAARTKIKGDYEIKKESLIAEKEKAIDDFNKRTPVFATKEEVVAKEL